MAILDPNTLIGIIQGKIGDLVFVRTKDGKVIVRRRPVGTPGSTPRVEGAEAHRRSERVRAEAQGRT